MNRGPKRTMSDEELDLALGEPKAPTTLEDLERELEEIKMSAWTANEHLASIRQSIHTLAFLSLVVATFYIFRVQDWPIWAQIKALFV